MRKLSILMAAALLGLLASPVLAQSHPQYQYDNYKDHSGNNVSGYNPFQLNWTTGRYYYAPIPPEQTGGPYQFNWYSGQWEYVPWPAPQSPAEIEAQSKSRPVHTVPNYGLSLTRPVSPEAIPAAAVIAPSETTRSFTFTIHKAKPTTARSQSLAATQPPQGQMTLPKDPLNIPATVGHWEYDSTTGRWIHVLPPG